MVWFFGSIVVWLSSFYRSPSSISLYPSIYLFIFLFNPFVIKFLLKLFPTKFSCILFMVMHLCLCEWVSALEMTVVVVMKKHNNDSFLNCVMIQSVDFEVFTWVAQLKNLLFSIIMFFRTNLLLALHVSNNIVAVKMNIDIDIHVKQTFIEHKSNLILCICIRVWLCVWWCELWKGANGSITQIKWTNLLSTKTIFIRKKKQKNNKFPLIIQAKHHHHHPELFHLTQQKCTNFFWMLTSLNDSEEQRKNHMYVVCITYITLIVELKSKLFHLFDKTTVR